MKALDVAPIRDLLSKMPIACARRTPVLAPMQAEPEPQRTPARFSAATAFVEIHSSLTIVWLLMN
jgi:hypothetical protein